MDIDEGKERTKSSKKERTAWRGRRKENKGNPKNKNKDPNPTNQPNQTEVKNKLTQPKEKGNKNETKWIESTEKM